MGRTRARLARSELDSQVQGHVATAERALQAAMRLVRQGRHGRLDASSTRYLRVEKDLARCITALGNVGQVAPLHDHDDPDLNESALDRWRQEREARLAPPESSPEPEPEPEAEAVEVNDG